MVRRSPQGEGDSRAPFTFTFYLSLSLPFRRR